MDRPYMIFMTVGKDDPNNLLLFIAQHLQIGDDVIDTKHVIFWKHESTVDNQDLSFVFI